ncbi:MAG: MlaE family lipid ABC transporter permease subunit [Thermoanaerobaculia bacterium]|nr:MlaE family lipid ABC transporter permease subunit [Thermoanaerobaculia bacterium]
MSTPTPTPTLTRNGATLSLAGAWRIGDFERLSREISAQAAGIPDSVVTIDLGAVFALDTAGAWLVERTRRELAGRGVTVAVVGAKPAAAALLATVAERAPAPRGEEVREAAGARLVRSLGQGTIDAAATGLAFVRFLGSVVLTLARTVPQPRRWRVGAVLHHLEEVGLKAVPIVALISFLIGVVLAYQGATQLSRFGAQVFVVDLVAIGVLREIGILLTAIVVAGRSGSAFTAQLGSMQLNEEVDALRTLGLDPLEVLVLPRLIALVVALPLLAVVADLLGLVGGGLMAWVELGIAPAEFVARLRQAISPWTFGVGVVKAPFFAALIALVGCAEGLAVRGGAEAVGRHTTRSVVESIFLVIVADAIFSIFFSLVGV